MEDIFMKKLIVLLFTIILLLPDCAFARKRNYNSLCSTQPASAPVQITLSEIGYSQGHTFIVQEGYNKGEIITNSPKIYVRSALKNLGKKTITAYSFSIQIFKKSFFEDEGDELIFKAHVTNDKCRIKPGKSSAETRYQPYIASNEHHNNIRHLEPDSITKIVYKLRYLKYSDGTSEGFLLLGN
jgi:hypothetical protein